MDVSRGSKKFLLLKNFILATAENQGFLLFTRAFLNVDSTHSIDNALPICVVFGCEIHDIYEDVIPSFVEQVNKACDKRFVIHFPNVSDPPGHGTNPAPPGFKHDPPENEELRCEDCPAVFYSPRHMRPHTQKHSSGKYVFCMQCGRHYRSQATLEEHMEWAHNKYQSEELATKMKAKDGTLPAVIPKKHIVAAREHWRQKFRKQFCKYLKSDS